jgi:hypothetical protein
MERTEKAYLQMVDYEGFMQPVEQPGFDADEGTVDVDQMMADFEEGWARLRNILLGVIVVLAAASWLCWFWTAKVIPSMMITLPRVAPILKAWGAALRAVLPW